MARCLARPRTRRSRNPCARRWAATRCKTLQGRRRWSQRTPRRASAGRLSSVFGHWFSLVAHRTPAFAAAAVGVIRRSSSSSWRVVCYRSVVGDRRSSVRRRLLVGRRFVCRLLWADRSLARSVGVPSVRRSVGESVVRRSSPFGPSVRRLVDRRASIVRRRSAVGRSVGRLIGLCRRTSVVGRRFVGRSVCRWVGRSVVRRPSA